MPLQQATSLIHLDLILICRKDEQGKENSRVKNPLHSAIERAQEQIAALKSVRIKVSLGDTKVILMGCFLREAHEMRSLDREERFLEELERNLDSYVAQVISSKGEVFYKAKEPEQLQLFEDMEKYLGNTGLEGAS